MEINLLDLILFLLFFVLVIGVSYWKSRKTEGETNTSDYFLAGRGLTWPLIGISIIAANLSTEQFVGMAGQGAGGVGLAVCAWQMAGSVGIVIIAFTLLPRFLKAGIYTMPEFLEYRYNSFARTIMAILTVIVYAAVLITAVLYSGGLTLQTIFGIPLTAGIWLIALIATGYTAMGGLKAVAWADLFQGTALLIGGILTFFLGLHAVGGWEAFTTVNADKLHVVLPASDSRLPWTGVASGMWIVIIYYCGLNQFIVQRNLAAKTMRDGQLGVIFAGALWLLVPFAIVMPGIMADQLFGNSLENADQAYPTLIRELIPSGIRGFMLAAIAGAVISSLGSMLNSTSTIFTMDVYKRHLNPSANEKHLILIGRITTLVAVLLGCLIAPQLADPRFGGVFNYIQQFQGYIWPGVVAAFLMALVLPKAPGLAGVTALLAAVIYGFFQFAEGKIHNLHFLIQVFFTFLIVCCIMAVIRILRPLSEPVTLPVREDLDIRSPLIVKLCGAGVLVGVVAFYIVFW